jgi:hypothetical protein
MRIKITIEYDGAGFAGWQRQQESRTVQEALEDAIEDELLFMDPDRTDAGVHAPGVALGEPDATDPRCLCLPASLSEPVLLFSGTIRDGIGKTYLHTKGLLK